MAWDLTFHGVENDHEHNEHCNEGQFEAPKNVLELSKILSDTHQSVKTPQE